MGSGSFPCVKRKLRRHDVFVIAVYLITANAIRCWSEFGHIDVWVFYGLRIARIRPCLLLTVVDALALAFRFPTRRATRNWRF